MIPRTIMYAIRSLINPTLSVLKKKTNNIMIAYDNSYSSRFSLIDCNTSLPISFCAPLVTSSTVPMTMVVMNRPAPNNALTECIVNK